MFDIVKKIITFPGKFVDWFEAERGTGEGKNGWVGKPSRD